MRIALGCMRLSTEPTRDDPRALETIEAALAAGVTVFDTARAYALDEHDLGHNERLLARALASGADVAARVITKCGMRRDGGAWIPDGRARTILEDASASAQALGEVPIDVLLLHAPDPRVNIATSARALARAKEDGLARCVGVSNVSRKQLEEAAGEAPIAAVQIALGAYDDLAIRSGVVAFCLERGIEIFAHAPLGGPERAGKLARDPVLVRIAASVQAAPIEVFLAYLSAVRPEIVPVVGARRAQTARSLAQAAKLELDAVQLAALDERFAALGRLRRPAAASSTARHDAEVVVLMGVPGSGKSRAAQAYEARGYERLNRDAQGGTLKKIARMLDERLAAGAQRIVLDNTYVTRASRYDVLRVASAHGAQVHCVHLETTLADAQINVVLRMIERFGKVLQPAELDNLARSDAAALAPHALFRMQRELEPPADDEGFASIERVPFVRQHQAGDAGMFVSLAALDAAAGLPGDAAPVLVFGWQPSAESIAVPEAAGRIVEVAVCPHAGGRPVCWCRPPLPALLLTFAHRHRIDLRKSTLIGVSAADRTMARALGVSFQEPRR